uniref:CUB domain-containing protein n=2 Tax=Mesocestoides corti TaxID=53468 RepID=A0A5K3EWL4_MESCO
MVPASVILFLETLILCLCVHGKMIVHRSSLCDTRNPHRMLCTFKMDPDDYVNITYSLGFAIEQTIPEIRSRCNASFEFCAKETGTSEFTLEGTFNGMDITKIVFSDGIQQATLLVRNSTDEEPPVLPRAVMTEPPILEVTDYKIAGPTSISLPFITKNPTATAFESGKTVANVFGLPTYDDCKFNYVCVTKTGGNSTIHLEGIITRFPTTFEAISMGNPKSVVFIFNTARTPSLFNCVLALMWCFLAAQ